MEAGKISSNESYIGSHSYREISESIKQLTIDVELERIELSSPAKVDPGGKSVSASLHTCQLKEMRNCVTSGV